MKKEKPTSRPVALSVQDVASLRDVTPSAVYRWLRLGLKHHKDPYGRLLVRRRDAVSFVPRPHGYPRGKPRKISPEMILQAETMKRDGKSLAEIGRTLGVSHSAVWYALRNY